MRHATKSIPEYEYCTMWQIKLKTEKKLKKMGIGPAVSSK
jgi:hypothetical protein